MEIARTLNMANALPKNVYVVTERWWKELFANVRSFAHGLEFYYDHREKGRLNNVHKLKRRLTWAIRYSDQIFLLHL